MRRFFMRFGAALLLALALPSHPACAEAGQWRSLEPGLDLGEFTALRPSSVGNSRITVLRVDPAKFSLGLHSANALKLPEALPINGWMREQKLVAAINAGMFEPDGSTTGYSRIGTDVLTSAWKAEYGAFLAFDPADASLPAVSILDSECDDVRALEKRYRVVLQSMRLVDCKGANLWQPSRRTWSTAALGVDNGGRVLFIMARSLWDVHDFIDNVKALPIGLVRAMYLEGGPEASLAVEAGGVSLLQLGGRDASFSGNDSVSRAWKLPNVIGVRRKEGAQ